MRTVTALLALPFALACAGNPDPVPVAGSVEDLSRMTGEWTGEYGSAQTGRSGSIVFRLEAGRDTAAGDVVMVPTGSAQALHPAHGPDVAESAMASNQLLQIRFVRVEGGRVSGALQPYHEPGCDCDLHTTFTGRLEGDSVTGTYQSAGPQGDRRTSGWWRIVRR
ncbi:MAG: hypothetical protein M3Y31_08920 [Gemmatimonadota bacterium]|nr:hypothetical protein [Gemmatimonadota bacterium]